jgi:hypothetical protein
MGAPCSFTGLNFEGGPTDAPKMAQPAINLGVPVEMLLQKGPDAFIRGSGLKTRPHPQPQKSADAPAALINEPMQDTTDPIGSIGSSRQIGFMTTAGR